MYFQQAEHNLPHIHAIYGEYMGIIDIHSLQLIEGDLPSRALHLIQEWLKIHKNEVLKIWHTQQFRKIPPLS